MSQLVLDLPAGTTRMPETDCIGKPDILLDLQLRVARRCDVLARWQARSRSKDRHIWLRAEQEVFARVERASRQLARQLANAATAEMRECDERRLPGLRPRPSPSVRPLRPKCDAISDTCEAAGDPGSRHENVTLMTGV
jgi:hypothetical protein